MADTLGNLKSRILRETEREGEPFDTGAKDAIISAIPYIQAKFYNLQTGSSSITVLSGETAANLPADMASLVHASFNFNDTIYNQSNGFLQTNFVSLQNMFQNTSNSSIPLFYAVFGTQFFIYPSVTQDTTFDLYYYRKDANYPAVDSDNSVWFSDETIDAVRYKALEIFYRDILQSPEFAAVNKAAFDDWANNLTIRNNQQQQYLKLSI